MRKQNRVSVEMEKSEDGSEEDCDHLVCSPPHTNTHTPLIFSSYASLGVSFICLLNRQYYSQSHLYFINLFHLQADKNDDVKFSHSQNDGKRAAHINSTILTTTASKSSSASTVLARYCLCSNKHLIQQYATFVTWPYHMHFNSVLILYLMAISHASLILRVVSSPGK